MPIIDTEIQPPLDHLVEGWDTEILDAITGHLLPGEADLLAHVFATHAGLDAGLKVMVSFMVKTMEDSTDRADWALDAQAVKDLGWLDDALAWDRAAILAYGPGIVTHAEMQELVEHAATLDGGV